MGYGLVEHLEVSIRDKERIRVVERLVCFSVFCTQSLRVYRLSVGVEQAVFLSHATHYRAS